MEFNQFLWNNFKESSLGKEYYSFFKNYFEIVIVNKKYEFYHTIRSSIAYKGTLDDDLENHLSYISNLYYAFTHDKDEKKIDIKIHNIDEAENFYRDILEMRFIDNNGNLIEEGFTSDDVPFLSEVLYAISPNFFIPYYFERLYQDIIEIFNTFGIFLPSVPKKNDKVGRYFHYFELCKSLYQFRFKHHFDEFDLPTFLYGFAINIIKRYSISEELPKARKAYFVGAGKKDSTVDSSADFSYLDNALSDTIANWNGDPETQTGDIIIMYCLSPRSYIHSIWRAVTPGSIDPFFHFYKNITIGRPIFVKHIGVEEIKADSVLNELSLVKANMQGINGRSIPKKYYDRLLELLKNKGQDISILPQLDNYEIFIDILENEKDIENKLLEPLLLKIGYTKDDWIRQLKLRMGRGDKVYPDYVILPHIERNNESCYWVWEAKYSINSHKQLEEDFGQAKSYALRLKSSGLGIVSREGVWLSIPEYNIKDIMFWSWKQINNHESLNEIFDIAGKKESKKRNV